MPGEFDFIDWIRAQTSRMIDPRIVIPIGDDLAAFTWSEANDGLVLAGADQVLDGVHFNSAVHSPREIGRKAMNRNLSDCAAMACLPTAALVTVALPQTRTMEYAKELFLGIKEAGDKFNCPIIGGDTGSWDGKLALSVTILGRSEEIAPMRRKGANVGHGIYVTGPLGGSLLGRHMTFEPRVGLGRLIASVGASSMIDLSDGLSRDIVHICRASDVGAVIEAEKLPIHEDAIEARRDGHSPLEHALHDGEDYELLFTAERQKFTDFARIGTIVAEPGVWLEQNGVRTPLEPKGWEHTL